MRFISPNTHGIVDYLMSFVLIVSPWLLGFYAGGAETWVPVIIGITMTIVSLMTDYKYSIANIISMQGHLTIDLISGLFLAASPWIFGFYTYVFVPHLLFGVLEIIASLTTRTSGQSTTHRRRAITA